jgi:thymidylate synthase (FAD)
MKTASIEVTLINSCGTDLDVVNAARVSFHKESEWEYPIVEGYADYEGGGHLSDKDSRLINYLAKHEHKSPFNHCFLSFRVKAPIFVARQLVKHRFMPWNEVSRRYVDEEPEFYFPDKWRKKAVDKKQGSGEYYSNESSDYQRVVARNITEDCLLKYNTLLNNGVCPEQARMVLPQNTMTEWIWSGTLGAFCDMLRLRLKVDTQEETRQVATLIAKDVAKLFPISYGALLNE